VSAAEPGRVSSHRPVERRGETGSQRQTKMTTNGTETEPNGAGIESIRREIDALERQSVYELRSRYLAVFGERPGNHHRLSLVRRLAWRLQAMAEGDLSERAKERAQDLARDADLRLTAPRWTGTQPMGASRCSHPDDPRLPPPGTILTRNFHGRKINVEVLDHGFRHEGVVYRSLSAVARLVAGTRWNGYAFFQLTIRGPK
jgi:Protein of unknown function (DUF2924)